MEKMQKSFALAATVLGLTFGAQAGKAPSVTYIDADGKEQTTKEYTLIDDNQSDTQELTNGVYVVGADYNEDGKIDAADALVPGVKTTFAFTSSSPAGVGSLSQAAVSIILADGFTLDATSGFWLKNNSSLTILAQEKGAGRLVCKGDPAIGGTTGCSLTVCGGNVAATGNSGGFNKDGKAGIGDLSTVTVKGGVVTAIGGDGGPKPAGGTMNPGPAFAVTTLTAADGILVKAGASAAAATEIPHSGTDNIAAQMSGQYARFVTPNYLTFTAEKAGSTIKFAKSAGKNLMINTNGEWVAYADSDLITLANAGDKVQFKGKGVQTLGEGGKRFAMTGRIGASGSVTSLTDENGGDPDVTLTSGCYANLFKNCAALTSLPDLPAMNLAAMCYGDMFNGCSRLAVNTNATEGSKLWFVPATESKNEWNTCMFVGTAGNFTGDPKLRTAYYVAPAEDLVTVVVPEVEGAKAQLYAFDTFGGWAAVATNEVPSNATVRVVWTADAGKGLTTNGCANVYQWQTEFGPVKGGETAPAPAVGEAGISEVTVSFDTRENKMYFSADQILPIWYEAGAGVSVSGPAGEETLVKNAANADTVAWVPAVEGTNELVHTLGGLKATIVLTKPVEVKTNGLEVAGAKVQVTDENGQALVAQTEEPFAGKIIVPSNSVVKVTYTAAAGTYFTDGSTVLTQTLNADKDVNVLSEVVTKPEDPKAPNVKLGVVAQRYPWDGKLDVQYWAKNTPNGEYAVNVTVTLPDGTEASESHDALNGVNMTTFDVTKAFGEVSLGGGVKVRAKIEKTGR